MQPRKVTATPNLVAMARWVPANDVAVMVVPLDGSLGLRVGRSRREHEQADGADETAEQHADRHGRRARGLAEQSGHRGKGSDVGAAAG